MNYEFNKENFDKIMSQFVQFDIREQRKEIIQDMQFIIGIEQKLCEMCHSKFDILYNKEMGDLKQQEVSEKDFLEAVYAYLYILKNGHYNFVNSIISKLMTIYQQQ